MHFRGILFSVLALLIAASSGVWALDDSYSKVLKHMAPKSSSAPGMGSGKWLVAAGAAVLLLILLARLSGRKKSSHRPQTMVGGKRRARPNFARRAASLGLRFREACILRKIAARLYPQAPDELLSDFSNLQVVISYLDKKIRQRQREIEVLRHIRTKLQSIPIDQALLDREDLRVEADLPVWLIKKMPQEVLSSPAEVEFDESPQIAATLIDLSEGGAAISADLYAGPGDLLEFWSADARVWIPPLTGGVVHVERPAEGAPLFHLHFIAPPQAELKAALQQLRENSGQPLSAE